MTRLYEEFSCHERGEKTLVSHRHVNGNDYEIILVLHGSGNVLLFDRTFPLRDGMLLLIDAACPHLIRPTDAGSYERDKIIVRRDYLIPLMEAAHCLPLLGHLTNGTGGQCVFLDEEKTILADSFFRKIASSSEDEQPLRLAVAILSLLPLFQSGTSEGPALPPEDEKLAPVLRYLRDKCTEALSIDAIAEDNHLSKYYLCRLFRNTVGMTIMQYVNEQRFALAKRLLTGTDRPIGDIGLACGFGSISHFCTVFRKHEGVSPHVFRNSKRAK